MPPSTFDVNFLINEHDDDDHLRDKERYWSKNMIFRTPLAFDAPVKGSPRQNIAVQFGVVKL